MKVTATIVKHPQGSEEWLQHRAKSLNASELAAAMGMSSYLTRSNLIAQKAIGFAPEVDAATQRRFDKGHEYEAIARPWAEEIIGDDLYPCVLAAEVDGLPLSASLDGQTMAGDVTWEHKSGNANLLVSLEAGLIPDEYHPQMEQGLMLSGASRCLFMASSGDKETMRYAWYESNHELRAKIIPTWRQVQADVASHTPTATAAKPIGKSPDSLPALRIEVTGMVTASNLAEFKETALSAIRSVNRDLKTDTDFANAEASVKWFSDVETRLTAAKQHALSQTASIDELFRTMDEISAEAKRVRLDLDKLVKARKEAIREDIVVEGRKALAAHLEGLNTRIGKQYMPQMHADFAAAIKGKRTIDSLRDAVNTTLANAKIEASAIADRIQLNLNALRERAADHTLLFADTAQIVLRQPDDVANLITARLAEHQAKEAARLEAQREQIRREEEAKAERAAREAHDKARAAVAAIRFPTPAPEVAAELPKPAPAPAAPVAQVVRQIRPAAQAEEATLKLGEICARLGLTLTAGVIEDVLGIAPAKIEKASKLYRPSDFARICDALIAHVQKAKAGELQAA